MISLEARMDLLCECVNIGLGRAAEALNRMCDSHVVLSAPEIRVMNRPTLTAAAAGRCPAVCEGVFLPFVGIGTNPQDPGRNCKVRDAHAQPQLYWKSECDKAGWEAAKAAWRAEQDAE